MIEEPSTKLSGNVSGLVEHSGFQNVSTKPLCLALCTMKGPMGTMFLGQDFTLSTTKVYSPPMKAYYTKKAKSCTGIYKIPIATAFKSLF